MFASAENGGAVILARSLWVPVPCFALLTALHLAGIWIAGDAMPFSDTVDFRKWLMERLRFERPLLLTIIAGAYTALYTRFASQWQYLADLYNQIKAKEIDISVNTAASPHADHNHTLLPGTGIPSPAVIEPRRLLSEWKYGFAVDAEYLHLSEKEPFKTVYKDWIRESEIDRRTSAPEKECPDTP